MNDEDEKAFDESVKRDGIREPLKINNDNVLLDGHSRYLKAVKYKITTLSIIRVNFEDKLYEKKYVIECNLQRRHLNNFQKVELGIPLLKIEQEIANKRKLSTLKHSKTSLASKDANEETGKSAKAVAKKIGVSTTTFERGKAVNERGTAEQKDKLRKGVVTISKVYQQMQKNEKRNERETELKKTQINLPNTVQLHNKPFQELVLQPGSVGLIITDPPYAEVDLDLYKDLAKQAIIVLKDGGSLLTYAGHFCIDRVIDYMKQEGLKYHWIISVVHSGASASVFGRKVLVAWKPMLWFTKGKYDGEFVKDLIKSEFQGKELHEWAQSTKESDYYIKMMTVENEIVYDPFLGQGTFGVSAVSLKRQFIGAEIDKDHFDNAQRLITIATKPGKK